ncbi:ribonuclease H1 [Etheostoma spectabile]|uniref:ribonuclease H1 n=1 Tax=Etheostoma spectabile TaxID=54343 RepID=UPI0013AFAD7D|nr:ribonuclease H1 [Etheostoma spectabile]
MLGLTGLFRAVTLRRAVCSAADDMAKGKFFYAVKKGFKPGVYSSWDECKSQVDKFPAAAFKKFASEKDAWAFFRGEEPSAVPKVNKVAQSVESAAALLPKRGPEPLEYIPLGKKRCHSDKEVESPPKRVKQSESSSSESTDGFTYMGDAVVFHGRCFLQKRGRKGAPGGTEVLGTQNPPLLQNVLGPEKGAPGKRFFHTKQIQINGVTSWVKNWKLNGWRLKSGGEITNKEDFVKLDRLNAELEVVWMHIPGHAGYRGNEEADRLSREGAVKPS